MELEGLHLRGFENNIQRGKAITGSPGPSVRKEGNAYILDSMHRM